MESQNRPSVRGFYFSSAAPQKYGYMQSYSDTRDRELVELGELGKKDRAPLMLERSVLSSLNTAITTQVSTGESYIQQAFLIFNACLFHSA